MIARLSLPLGTVLGLAVGEVLPLVDVAIDRIVMAGADGRPLAVGKLGQFQGHRAIRITECLDAAGNRLAAPEVVDHAPDGAANSVGGVTPEHQIAV